MSGKKIENNKHKLVDIYGRVHNYLRLSITEQCNFACTYCMPDNKDCKVSDFLMSTKEIIELATAFTEHGINKIRLTGGEPLVRNDFEEIIESLGNLPVELVITTNGYLLDKYFNVLKSASVKRLNISLDTLRSDRFKAITQRNAFDRVYANIILAIKLGFQVKLNAVIMRGTNDDEILDFVRLTQKHPITLRFIEFMPFKGNNWNSEKSFSQDEMLQSIASNFELKKEEKLPDQKAEYYSVVGAPGKFGIIPAVSEPFCDKCNRIRVMADGKLKNCLFGTTEYDLITPFREGKDISEVLRTALGQKHELQGGHKTIKNNSSDFSDNRDMYSIGG